MDHAGISSKWWKILLWAGILIPLGYLVYRVADNYFYLEKNYWETNTRRPVQISGIRKLVLRNISDSTCDTLNLADENVILNFNATWCKPCVEELPQIKKLLRDEQEQHYKIYCIFNENIKVVKLFSEKHQLQGSAFQVVSGWPAALKVTMIPATFICAGADSGLMIEGGLTNSDMTLIWHKFNHSNP